MAAVLQVMQDYWAYDKGAIWSAAGLGAGIAGMGGICGNVAGALAAYGLRLGQLAGDDREAARAGRRQAEAFARQFYRDFVDRFGHVDCRDLIPYDLSTPDGARAYLESGIWQERCFQYAEFAVRALFAADPTG